MPIPIDEDAIEDMDEVFKIVVPPADGTNSIDDTQTKDLFANYSNST